MTMRDLLMISAGNLRRMKLRTTLTTSGVLIAIAAFVAMLSFGAGNQQYVEQEFRTLGLFTTMQVYPRTTPGGHDSLQGPKLDREAMERLAAIPGVNLVYPYEAFMVTVRMGDTVMHTKAQALPTMALRTRLFSSLAAGSPFEEDSTRQVLISEEFLKKAGIARPDSMLGSRIIISVKVSTPDSGLAYAIESPGEPLMQRLARLRTDSLMYSGYRNRALGEEFTAAMQRYLRGYLQAQETVTDTLTICGIHRTTRMGRLRGEPLIVPLATAARFSDRGTTGTPTEMLSAFNSGALLTRRTDRSGKTFSQVTLDFDPGVFHKAVRDSVEALGYRTFSFAAQFEELQRIFLTFDMAIGIIGLIALVTASLGIVNTMVMSITERRREIGVLKSLGADDLDIRWLFLVESGIIGLLGTSSGILCGWVLSRIVSAIARAYMRGQGIPEIELFALPPWLFLLALGIGLSVSLLAGFYPAARAARVDPVEALRND